MFCSPPLLFLFDSQRRWVDNNMPPIKQCYNSYNNYVEITVIMIYCSEKLDNNGLDSL